MKRLLLVLTILTGKAQAQSAEEAIKKPIILLFDAMRKGDSLLLRAAFAPTAILQTIAQDKNGKIVITTDEVNDFITAVSKPHTDIYDERITFETIKTDGDLAAVWTPYHFYIGDTFSHCGVNSFQLIRIEGEWKVQYIIDTRRRDNCK